MTRDEFAKQIHWNQIIWIAGFVNISAMLPQLYKIISTRDVKGLSLEMFSIYFAVQIAFSLQGFFRRDTMLMVFLAISALISATIIISVLYLRSIAGP